MTIEEKQRIVYRDSINGQFITRREEEKRPSTTQKERLQLRPSTSKPFTSTGKKGE